MTFLIAWASAADLVAELVGVTQEIAKREITGEPRDTDLETRFVDLMAQITNYTQKGMQK